MERQIKKSFTLSAQEILPFEIPYDGNVRLYVHGNERQAQGTDPSPLLYAREDGSQ
jgi:hypothetical protein